MTGGRVYIRRQGRMTRAQALALERDFATYRLADAPFDAERVFGRTAPLVLEVGFGMGQGLLAYASSLPEADCIGAEVYRPGIGSRVRDGAFPLPGTLNLTGYLDTAPPALSNLPTGYHDRVIDGAKTVVYVTDRGGQRLYLVFDRSGVGRLATVFGLLPLAMVLLVLYLSTWLAFRASRRAFSPVIALARQVRGLDPAAPDPAQLDPGRLPRDADDEVRELAAALARYAQRLNEFVERERNFTRDASHELRSPLTVIQMAAGMLEADAGLRDASRRSVARIVRAARDMEELTSAFLLLARESQTGLPLEATCVNDVLVDELDRARLLAAGKPIESRLSATHRLYVDAPEKVLPVLLGNLLRNAFSYKYNFLARSFLTA